MRHLPAHDADVGPDRHGGQAAPVEDVEIGLIMGPVLGFEASLIGVQAVAVLHRKLPNPEQPRAGPRIVPPLGLEMVDQLRQLAIGPDLPANQVAHDLFVSHGEHHVAAGTVLKAAHFVAHLVPAPRLLPDVGRVHDRHGDLLPADRVHLPADDLLHLVQRTSGQGADRRRCRWPTAGCSRPAATAGGWPRRRRPSFRATSG